MKPSNADISSAHDDLTGVVHAVQYCVSLQAAEQLSKSGIDAIYEVHNALHQHHIVLVAHNTSNTQEQQ